MRRHHLGGIVIRPATEADAATIAAMHAASWRDECYAADGSTHDVLRSSPNIRSCTRSLSRRPKSGKARNRGDRASRGSWVIGAECGPPFFVRAPGYSIAFARTSGREGDCSPSANGAHRAFNGLSKLNYRGTVPGELPPRISL